MPYDTREFTAAIGDTAQQYIETSLGGRINPDQGMVTNATEVTVRIQARVRTYLLYARDAAKESIFNTAYRKQIKPALVNQATFYFWDYLLRKGELSQT